MNQGVRPKHTDEYECSGPRPPVPGQESRISKMTEGNSFEHNLQRTSPPSYFKWDTLKGLLEDPEGLELFNRYVQTEGGKHYEPLEFYICCEGLKQQPNDDKARDCILAINRRFLRKRQLSIPIPDNFKEKIAAIKNREHKSVDRHIFDSMQEEALRIITKTTYHSFFKSDVYIQHIADAMSATQAGCASNSSSSGSGNGPLHRSTLATVVEDQELSIQSDDVSLNDQEGNQTPMRLTRDLLLATQRRRLEVRPPGTHGYSVYNASLSASYNPVSRQDSERQSCSSGGGGKSDSDTMSVTSSRDGRPHVQRRQSSLESKAMQNNALINKETNTFAFIPLTQRKAGYEYRPPSTEELLSQLIPKLEEIRRKQQVEERFVHHLNQADLADSSSRVPPIPSKNQSHFHQGQVLADALFKRLQLEDDNDQSILDQHVSRVWSDLTPHRSPGTISPCPAVPSRRRTHDTVTTGDSSMRHSKSMPEHASSSKRLTNKWPSMNTDSGISLFSTDTTLRSRDLNSRSRSVGIDSATASTAFQLEEARRRLEDEPRRSRRHSQHPASQVHQQLPSVSSVVFESTVTVYTYLDEDLPYRSKLPGLQPTLRLFKEYLPKKGNFRFFFKTACEDPENPIIQEEIVNDDDILPLFEGKVMGLVKPYE